MKFITLDRLPEHLETDLIYMEGDYAIDAPGYPEPETACTSLCVNTTQIRMDDQAILYYCYGYTPLTVVEPTIKYPIDFEEKVLSAVLLAEDIVPGVSYRVNEGNEWRYYINKKERWACIGDPAIEGRELIHFAPGAVAALEGDEMVALWLHPKELPQSVLGKA